MEVTGDNEEEVAKAWDSNAKNWIPQVAKGLDVLRDVVDAPTFRDHFLPDLTGQSVLDLGCGEGRSSRLMAAKGARIVGVDLSTEMINAAKDIEHKEKLGIEYRIDSFTNLTTVEDGSFDAAASMMAFMDGPSFDKACEEAYRVVKPGGNFYFSSLHPCFWTKGSHWARANNGRLVGRLVSNYWSEGRYWDGFSFLGTDTEKFKIPRYPYRLEQYVNSLADAGWVISKIMEPRPTEDMVKAHPSYLGMHRNFVPVLIYIAARKL